MTNTIDEFHCQIRKVSNANGLFGSDTTLISIA